MLKHAMSLCKVLNTISCGTKSSILCSGESGGSAVELVESHRD